MKKTDIVVIGAGMAGVTSAIYLKRANAEFVILEGSKLGGRLNELKEIENYPGFKKVSGSEIALSLKNQLEELDIPLIHENVQTILKDPEGFEVKTDKEIYKAKAVIVASGLRNSSETITGEKQYFGIGVSYCATCDGNFFKNQDVAVIGNNNIALEESLYLSNLVKHLYLIVPSNELEGDEQLINKIKSLPNVKVLLNKKVNEIVGDDFGVSGVNVDGEIINVSGVFPYLGHKSATEFLKNLNPSTTNNALITDEGMQTNIEGLFAAGDIVCKKVRQLVTAASDGAIAATNAFIFVKQK